MRAEVLVVGGGAAGASVSYLLAKRGIKVTLVERKREIGRPHHCSGILGSKAIQEMVYFDESWVLSEVRWASFRSPGGVTLRIEKDVPLAKVVDRRLMDKELIELAASEGAEVLLATPFLRIEGDRAIIRGGDVSFELLIGADGASSTVASSAGMRPIDLEVGVNVMVDRSPGEGYEVRLVRGSWFTWWQPWGDRGKRGGLGPIGSPVIRWVGAKGQMEGGLIPRWPRKEVVRGNIALVGDSAGQVKPISRGGVYYLSRASKSLAEAVESYFDGKGLKSYSGWWKSVIRSEVMPALAFRGWLERLHERQIDKVFDYLKGHEDVLTERFDTDAQLEPAKGLGVNLFKLLSVNPRALIGALWDLVARG